MMYKKCTDQNSTSSYTCYKGTTNARSSVLFVSGSGHAGVGPKSRMVMVAGFRGLALLGLALHCIALHCMALLAIIGVLGMEWNAIPSHPIVILVVVVILLLGSPGLDRIQVPLAPGVPRNHFHEARGPQLGRHGFACGGAGAGAGAASCWWFGTTLPPRTNPGTTRSEVWGGAMVVVVVVVVVFVAVAIAVAIAVAVTTSFDGLGPERRVPAAAGCHRLVPGDCFCRWHQGKRA